MRAAAAGRATVSEVITFYAGPFRIDVDTGDEAVNGHLAAISTSVVERIGHSGAGCGAASRAGDDTAAALVRTATAPALVRLFGDCDGIVSGLRFATKIALLPDTTEAGARDDGFAWSFLGRRLNLFFHPDDVGERLATLFPRGITLGGEDSHVETLRNLCVRDAVCEDAFESWSAALSQIVEEEIAGYLHEKTHWIPYAFGAAPIRLLSDPVAQETHGLIGVVDVLPRDWNLTEAHGFRPAPATYEGARVSEGHRIDAAGRRVVHAFPLRERARDGMPADFLVTNGGEIVTVREFVLFFRNGLNLWDSASRIDWTVDGRTALAPPGLAGPGTSRRARPVPDCMVCDDSYDRGDVAVNYRSPALASVLSQRAGGQVEASDDLNPHVLPPDWATWAGALDLEACENQQVVIRLVHPAGRARQRAFVMNGYSYHDLFPGFGFPRGALLAPGKSLTTWLDPLAIAGSRALWHDGPTQILSGGAWGRLSVAGEGQCPSAP